MDGFIRDSMALTPATGLAAEQASTDDGMITLWLESFRSPHTRRGYETDIRAFGVFTSAPLRSITVRDL